MVSSVGYSFEPKGLSIAPKTLANFLDSITRLYEQGADSKRIGQYVRNWWRWVRAGVEMSLASQTLCARGRYFILWKSFAYLLLCHTPAPERIPHEDRVPDMVDSPWCMAAAAAVAVSSAGNYLFPASIVNSPISLHVAI